MTDNISFKPPRGMRDFYPEDMALRTALFDAWHKAAGAFGFEAYDACVVESLDLLKRKSGEEIVDQIYSFKDKSGRDLALRPEMTPSLARMIVARYGALNFPLKWYSIPQCFRYERTTRGRKREHYQWNLDIIGSDGVYAEAEVIATAVHALKILGLTNADITIRFSNRALLSDLLSACGIDASHHQSTFLALDKRGKIPDEEIEALLAEDGLDSSTIGKVFKLLDISSLEDAEQLLASQTSSYTDVLDFIKMLELYGIADMATFDISVVRGLSYYTGIVFEAFDVERNFRAVFGGGRYDNLLTDIGGKPATGVGLGFGDVVIGELLAHKNLHTELIANAGMVIGYMDEAQRGAAMQVATSMRSEGKSVDLALSPEKAKSFFTRVGKSGATEAIYIGPDDVASGTVRIKDLNVRTERTVEI